jgi:hypothetical protein
MSKHIHLHIHDSAFSYNGTYDPKDLSEEEKARIEKRKKQGYYKGSLYAPNNPILKKTNDKCSCK